MEAKPRIMATPDQIKRSALIREQAEQFARPPPAPLNTLQIQREPQREPQHEPPREPQREPQRETQSEPSFFKQNATIIIVFAVIIIALIIVIIYLYSSNKPSTEISKKAPKPQIPPNASSASAFANAKASAKDNIDELRKYASLGQASMDESFTGEIPALEPLPEANPEEADPEEADPEADPDIEPETPPSIAEQLSNPDSIQAVTQQAEADIDTIVGAFTPVIRLNATGSQELETYFAEDDLFAAGYDVASVIKCCNGEQNSHKKFRWKFA